LTSNPVSECHARSARIHLKGKLFGDGDYVGFTAWPGMQATVTGDGWLGIAPAGQRITMRSLDFWRCENGLIRENGAWPTFSTRSIRSVWTSSPD
jgi:hypothetical protein